MSNDEIVQLVYDAIDEFNAQQSRIKLEKNSDTILFGRDGSLDSLGLVNLIVAVEEKIEDKYGQAITLADEKALSQSRSPFRDVTALAQYIKEKLGV